MPRPIEKPVATITISPARLAAFQVLVRVGSSSDHSDDLLYGKGLERLSQQDKNLTTALVLGVLRWQIALDARLKPLLSNPNLKLDEMVAISLRLGAFQLLYMDKIPVYAAVGESVELARRAGFGHAAGLVNAVLRALTRTKERVPLVQTPAFRAEKMGHPAWLVERWNRFYSAKNVENVLEFDQKTVVDRQNFVDETSGSAGWAIDDGSRLVAELAAAVGGNVEKVWDCCAAPGGKTSVLAARLPEAEMLATDVSPRRLKAMAARLGSEGRIRTLVADATKLPEEEGLFDLVLCDAPCSGTGTLQRNPEIRLRVTAAELPRQAERQREILAAALRRLKPGGRVLYSTCSLEPEEGEQVIEAVLAEDDSAAVVPVGPVLAGLEERGVLKTGVAAAVTRGHFLRTLPGANFEGDGFFAAVLERR